MLNYYCCSVILSLIRAQVTFLNYHIVTVDEVLCFGCFLMITYAWDFKKKCWGVVCAIYQCSMIFSIDRPEPYFQNEPPRLAYCMKNVEIQGRSYSH